eukprot:Hpha_TRINITY_DN19520_c0_g1::TRINITY_DN19520_c0_g1_i1::g.33510::m.33510
MSLGMVLSASAPYTVSSSSVNFTSQQKTAPPAEQRRGGGGDLIAASLEGARAAFSRAHEGYASAPEGALSLNAGTPLQLSTHANAHPAKAPRKKGKVIEDDGIKVKVHSGVDDHRHRRLPVLRPAGDWTPPAVPGGYRPTGW